MKNKLIKILPIIIITVLISYPSVTGVENSHSQEYEHVKTLTNIGPRLAGTEAEDEAVQYIENEFKNYGLSTNVKKFQLENGYIFKKGQLSIQTPFKENLKFSPLIRSPPTQGEIIDNLIYLENVPENTTSLQDQIILTRKKNIFEIKKTPTQATILFQENKPDWSNIWPPDSLKSPTVTVSYETAEFLIKLLEGSDVDNVTVKLELDSEMKTLTSHNVIATLPGEIDETIIVSAHHDSVLTPGAIDDGTGVAILLETARELSDENLLRTVKFVSFGAEEYGLIGSKEFVEDVEKDKIAGVLDFDVIGPGSSNGLRIGVRDYFEKSTTRWLDVYVGNVAEDKGLSYSFGTFEEVNGYSDYVSFIEKNIPATWIYWVSDQDDDPLWMVHTSEDNLDLVSENNLKVTSRFSVNSVTSLSTGRTRGWFWDYGSPEKISIFLIFSSALVIVGIAGSSYLRYVRKRKNWLLVVETGLLVTIGIFVLYFWLF